MSNVSYLTILLPRSIINVSFSSDSESYVVEDNPC
jgi:hypothetical protein